MEISTSMLYTLREATRLSIEILENEGSKATDEAKRLLVDACVIENQHVGNTRIKPNSIEQIEWYAGQILSILIDEQYVAVNSLINCLDKFCPREATNVS